MTTIFWNSKNFSSTGIRNCIRYHLRPDGLLKSSGSRSVSGVWSILWFLSLLLVSPSSSCCYIFPRKPRKRGGWRKKTISVRRKPLSLCHNILSPLSFSRMADLFLRFRNEKHVVFLMGRCGEEEKDDDDDHFSLKIKFSNRDPSDCPLETHFLGRSCIFHKETTNDVILKDFIFTGFESFCLNFCNHM